MAFRRFIIVGVLILLPVLALYSSFYNGGA
jgi:hypothetical protein